MKSVYTGTEHTGRYGVKANGLQFGFAAPESILLNYICTLSEFYNPVQVYAANVWGFGKWPYIVLLLPEQKWFKDQIEEARQSASNK